jgi:hypothetical protein
VETKRVNYKYSINLENPHPVLIIDINMQNGLKEVINVHDGDTPEDLAAAFAQKHSTIKNFILELDKETEQKLCVEIKSSMSVQLLNEIEEEEHFTMNTSIEKKI